MNIQIKGWCPGALRPMESGDGLLVRVKPRCSALTLDQLEGIADIAERLGNGHIDLTRRANLQIRGLAGARMPALRDALDQLGLLDPDERTEAARNIMVGPFAGPDARALAEDISRHLDLDVPPKFGWLVDGPPYTIIDERADVAFALVDGGVAVRRHGQWSGLTSGGIPVSGPRPAGIAAAFGRLEAPQLSALVALARKAGATEVRLSPWRALYFDVRVFGAERLGLIADPADPLLRIDACPGAPSCRSASVDTRAAARRLAARPFQGTIHVSGCAKSCARSQPADLVLVGDQGRYGVIHGGTTRDRLEGYILPDDL